MKRGQMLKQAMLIVLALAQLLSGYSVAEYGGHPDHDSSMLMAEITPHCGLAASDGGPEAPSENNSGNGCVSHSSCCCASGSGTLPSVLTSLTFDASDVLPRTTPSSYHQIPVAVELRPPRCLLRSA